jgi:hypothetical protein
MQNLVCVAVANTAYFSIQGQRVSDLAATFTVPLTRLCVDVQMAGLLTTNWTQINIVSAFMANKRQIQPWENFS